MTSDSFIFTLMVLAIIAAVIFGFSPAIYAVGHWHCFWFPNVPVCQ